MTRSFVARSTLERRLVLAVAIVGFAAMFALTLAIDDADDPGAIVFMPFVALVALELGIVGGLVSAVAGLALWALARTLQDAGPGVGALAARAIPFLALAILIGWLASRLQRSREAHRRLMLTANEGILIVDTRGVTRFVNERMASLLGSSPEELVGRPVPVPGLVELPPVAELGRPPTDVELPRPGRPSVWGLVSRSALVDERGNVTGSLAMVTDITDRKRAEELLEQAQRTAHVGAWTWSPVADELTWSDELYRIHGLDAAEPLTLARALDLVDPADRDRVEAALRASAETSEPFDLTYRIVRPDGSPRILEVSGAAHAAEGGRAVRVAGMALDVTDRLEAEEALAAARVARRQATELNDNVVQGLVLAKYALDRDDGETATRMIDGTLGHARRMITDLIGSDDVKPGDLRREEAAGVDGA